MAKMPRKTSSKNPPILSHEFVIQNHADIISCVAMVFVVGLMVQATTPLASVFITMQHLINTTTTPDALPDRYTTGLLDLPAIFFYTLICIVIHAIIQEYLLDKLSKRFHLSKLKLAVLNNSGQLAIFYAVSAVWGMDVVLKERFLPDVYLLWNSFPVPIAFVTKLYLVIHMAYSLHEIPELYFQRVKRDEWAGKAAASVAAFALTAVPYFLNFNGLLICLITLHATTSFVDHVTQLLQAVDKEDKLANLTRGIAFGVMVSCRVASIILAVLTLWFGLAQLEQQPLDIAAGNFNVPVVRLSLLAITLIAQMYLISAVMSRELQRAREAKNYAQAEKSQAGKTKKSKDKTKKSKKESDLPEVDQDTNKNLKLRAQKAK